MRRALCTRRVGMLRVLGIAVLCLTATIDPSWATSPPTLRPQLDPVDACNAADFQTLLQSAPAPLPEPTSAPQAVWLSAGLLQWPGTSAKGRFTLYHTDHIAAMPQVGDVVGNDYGAVALKPYHSALPGPLAKRFHYLAGGVVLAVGGLNRSQLRALQRHPLLLVQEDTNGRVLQTSAIQMAGALDDLYAKAAQTRYLGVSLGPQHTRFTLWAPTAAAVHVCLFGSASASAQAAPSMQRDEHTGIWRLQLPRNLQAQYYSYLVDVWVPGRGLVRNRVTDPYSISLNADSQRSYIADLNDATLKPAGWDQHHTPATVRTPTDMAIYELHVRDFSINDDSVPENHRGKYLAFTDSASKGMRHLQALARAGMTDVHLLPIFDIASVPERGCTTPAIATPERGDSEAPQAATTATAATDCFNWGYDPLHFNAPEGSYASNADDGAARIRELRRMVMALHAAGLRVGMDVVYNHTSASGQHAQSVLDRIVPGYYHRLSAQGAVERSTCCDNTATENRMMGKLLLDSVTLWAQQYRMDSFRFDLMAHQPRALMQALQAELTKTTGRRIPLIGEGWNFGEVADGARFVQASQLSLNGSGIGTFSDRGRDALRGGNAGDSGEALLRNQGYTNGMVYDPNAYNINVEAQVQTSQQATQKAPRQDPPRQADLLRTADLVRVGLAGSIRSYAMQTSTGQRQRLADIHYAGQPAGYASEPSEVVNYVENHDNQTLFDNNIFKLPVATSTQDRVRVQMLALAVNAFSQGVAYFHAGSDILRSKSLDRNSYNSGDWFNRLDWSLQTNSFGSGLPPRADNGDTWPLMRPLLTNPQLRPTPADIALARDMFLDLLRIRASSTLFHLRTAADIRQRLRFDNTGPTQNPVVQVGHLDGRGYPGSAFTQLLYFVNVDKVAQTVTLPHEMGKPYHLHPVQLSASAADTRVRAEASYSAPTGRFTLPPRSAVVYVMD